MVRRMLYIIFLENGENAFPVEEPLSAMTCPNIIAVLWY